MIFPGKALTELKKPQADRCRAIREVTLACAARQDRRAVHDNACWPSAYCQDDLQGLHFDSMGTGPRPVFSIEAGLKILYGSISVSFIVIVNVSTNKQWRDRK